MNYFEKVQDSIKKSAKKKIYDKINRNFYTYGENPYYDMIISNCVFCDMFPEEVPNKFDFCGFNRSLYSLYEEQAAG